jgi:sugar lactone lactonase YvrE
MTLMIVFARQSLIQLTLIWLVLAYSCELFVLAIGRPSLSSLRELHDRAVSVSAPSSALPLNPCPAAAAAAVPVFGRDHARVLPYRGMVPYGVALDPDGTVWAAGGSDREVVHFSPNGSLLGSFSTPSLNYRIHVDGSGSLWIPRPFDHPAAVVQLSREGALLQTIESPSFLWPNAVGTDTRGNVWVTDRDASQALQFSPNGSLIQQFAVLNPVDLFVDNTDADQLYVQQDNQTSQFSPNGSLMATYTGNSTITNGIGFTKDRCGALYIASEWKDSDYSLRTNITKVSSDDAVLQVYYTRDWNVGAARGLAVDSSCSALYASDMYNGRVVKLDIKSGRLLTVMNSTRLGTQPLSVALPSRAGADTVYFVDGDAYQIIGVNGSDGRSVALIINTGIVPGDDVIPQLSVDDAEESFFITDTDNHRILRWARTGSLTRVYTTANPPLSSPHGTTVDAAGNVYIADTGNSRVVKLDGQSGRVLAEFRDAFLDEPVSVALDSPRGLLYASNDPNGVGAVGVIRFNLSAGANVTAGEVVISQPCPAQGLPICSIAVDPQGNLYKVVHARVCVQYDPSGRCTFTFLADGVDKYDAQGTMVAQYYTYEGMGLISSIAFSPDGDLVVADLDGSLVVVFNQPTANASVVSPGQLERRRPGHRSASAPMYQVESRRALPVRAIVPKRREKLLVL